MNILSKDKINDKKENQDYPASTIPVYWKHIKKGLKIHLWETVSWLVSDDVFLTHRIFSMMIMLCVGNLQF